MDSAGLGLTICKLFMDAQGGSIDIKSRQEVGTTVTLTFRSTLYSRDAALGQAQSLDKLSPADPFSLYYIGLQDAAQSPYREG